jgi:hypothetical protein
VTETTEHSASQSPPIVSAADFHATDFERPAFAGKQLATWKLASDFARAAREAEATGQAAENRVFRLLSALCQIHLRPDDRANVWGSAMTGGNWRTAVPEDFKGEQSEILRALLPNTKHPSLRARLADIVWSNDRRAIEAGAIAVEAYRECVEALLAARADPELAQEGRASLTACEFMKRALQIAQATEKKLPGRKKADLPEPLVRTLRSLYERAKSESAYVVFRDTAGLGLYYELFEAATVARDAETVAASAGTAYPAAVRAVLELGVAQYTKIGDRDGERRCRLAVLDNILSMRGQVNSAGAEAFWVSQALHYLQQLDGVEDREEALLRELRQLQRKAIKEFSPLSFPMEIGGERDRLLATFDEFSLSKALRHYATLTQSKPVDELKAEARKAIEASPLASMFGTAHIDGEGKTITSTPGADGRTEPDEAWYRQEIDRAENLRRQLAVAAGIDPVRMLLQEKFNIQERHLDPILASSPFVPQSQAPILSLGFARFFQADFMSAAHLVIPQLEPCLRHVLKMAGHDPAKRFPDTTEEDHNLVGLLARFRPELDHILTAPLAAEIEALFHAKPGPALRHAIAHGLVSAGACFHHSVIYAIWLMYRVCCLFTLGEWEAIIAPAIDAESA